VTFIKN